MKPSVTYTKRTISVKPRRKTKAKYNRSHVGADKNEKLGDEEFERAVMPKRNRPKAKKIRSK